MALVACFGLSSVCLATARVGEQWGAVVILCCVGLMGMAPWAWRVVGLGSATGHGGAASAEKTERGALGRAGVIHTTGSPRQACCGQPVKSLDGVIRERSVWVSGIWGVNASLPVPGHRQEASPGAHGWYSQTGHCALGAGSVSSAGVDHLLLLHLERGQVHRQSRNRDCPPGP